MSSDLPQTQESTRKEDEPVEGEIDLEALAEKVCRLLQEEAQLERERLGRRQVW